MMVSGPARLSELLWPLLVTCCWRLASAQELPTNGVNGYSLHPPYFNLAEGTKITATATCGEDETGRSVQDLYCKLVGGPVSGDPSQTIQGQYCDICSQGHSDRAHPITNAIDGTERWWQSPPLSRSTEFNRVNVTLDLGQVGLLPVSAALLLLWCRMFPELCPSVLRRAGTFQFPFLWSPLPEREDDVKMVFRGVPADSASKRDCIERFGQSTIERISHDDDIVCTTEYSRIVPLENGEIVVSLVNGRPGAMNFSYSPVLREFTKATNIRLRFLRTNTLLGHLMGKALRDPTVTRRYYYSIKDISIGGRCVCNGHAEACNAKDPSNPYKLQCDCQHHTCGVSCDQCCPGYHQLAWKPATTYSANECEHNGEQRSRRTLSERLSASRRPGRCWLNKPALLILQVPLSRERLSPQKPLAVLKETLKTRAGSQHAAVVTQPDLCCLCPTASPTHPTTINGEARPAGEIINCECSAAGTVENSCRADPRTGTCICKPGFTGDHCDACAPGFYGLNCEACQCAGPGCLDGSCDEVTGHGVCRSGFLGPQCDRCAPGYFSYPLCQLCGCSSLGSLPEGCDAAGRCLCRPEFQGPRCEQCRSGFHSYPDCKDGNNTSVEAPPLISTQRCRGVSARTADDIQRLQALRANLTPRGRCTGRCHPAGSVQTTIAPPLGRCECRLHVGGLACDTCKPLYWNLSPDTPEGCSSKTHTHTRSAILCGERSGHCRCRPNVEGPKCNLPRPDHYFPDLHHLKFEIEEGSMLDGRPVRFGYNPQEFPNFSWRGYAQMSPIQSKVSVSVSVDSPDVFFVVLRYVNRRGSDVWGRMTVVEDGRSHHCGNCSEQSKPIVFAPSAEPTFVNVPFVEPFVLNPGTWTVVIEAEGVLLDYLVLLPSAYYEAPVLQIRVSEPCTYSPAPDASQNCLLYKYLSLDSFPSISGNDASCRNDNHLPRPCPTEKVSPRHPDMAVCSGLDISVELRGRLSSPGDYFILHYHQPLHPTYPVQVFINGGRIWQGHVNASFCPHAYGCRDVLVSENQIILDVTDHELLVTVQIPAGKTLWLDYLLVVPESSYSSSYLSEEPLDKSYDFIRLCGQNSFYISPSSSPFCLSSAISLSAFVNNGALPCACHEVGAESDTCERFGGQCRCRPNVIGRDCSMCSTGYWGFPNCRLVFKQTSADITDVPDVYQELYWHAPNTYLGDKVSSYGGYLRYRLHTQTMRGDVLPLPAEAPKPDIILKGNQMTLVFMEREYSSPEEPHLGIVHIVEGSFRHFRTGNPVSREELMMVLVGLESLQIRALHSQSAQSVSLRGAVLEGAESLPVGRHANNVEICLCPANYLGDSCQKCAPGYYRDTIGLFLGKCVPCSCNGHSDQCLDGSGICVNCRHNTAGDHCETCQGGFLGNNSVDGQAVTCSSCPCPLRAPSNNFAEGCVQRGDSMQCRCMPGYAGPNCESRHVIGQMMSLKALTAQRECDCRGGHCDPRTGECRCPDGMTGRQCDGCLQRYSVPTEDRHGVHCELCDSCVVVLLEDLEKLDNDFLSASARLRSLNASSVARAQLQSLDKSMEDAARAIEDYNNTLQDSLSRTDMLEAEISTISEDIEELQNKVRSERTHTHDCSDGPDPHFGSASCKGPFVFELTGRPSVSRVLVVLDRVSRQLVDRQEENDNLTRSISDRLSRLHADTMDLRDALNEAVNNTARAAEINNANEKSLDDHNRRVVDLQIKSTEVRKQLNVSADHLHQVNNDVWSMVQNSKEEYEHLAAQLDGARMLLAQKVQNLSQTNSKIPLVEKAEKHAELLGALAMNLSSLIAETKKDGFIDVTQAYNKIVVSIEEAEEAAKMASEAANSTLEVAEPSKGYSGVLFELHISDLHRLGEAIPELLKRLGDLQNYSVQMPNISENINRIRQLIEQARNAANKVSVSMKFNGKSGVQVRTPPNLADLAAYTSMKLHIKLPDAVRTRRQDASNSQFVFYLGNKNPSQEFLGMALVGKQLHWYFNVGGGTADVMMTNDIQSKGRFSTVLLERILQHGLMSVSMDTTTTKHSNKAEGDQGLLKLSANDTVFYVGGYPNTFTPPEVLALPNFKGCIELDYLNEEVISLYNFVDVFNLNTTVDIPCARMRATSEPWVSDGAYFDGTGYAKFNFSQSDRGYVVQQEIKLLSQNGILLMMQNEKNQFVCVAVLRGQVRLFYNINGSLVDVEPVAPPELLQMSNGESNSLDLIVWRELLMVRNNQKETIKTTIKGMPQFDNSCYLGGVPKDKMPELLKDKFPKTGSVKACIRNLKERTQYISLKKVETYGVSFGCHDNLLLAREGYFPGQGYLNFNVTDASSIMNNFFAGLGFRTEKTDGLMFFHKNQEDVCQVFLQKGHVVVQAGNKAIKTQKTYNDDISHYVTIYNNVKGIRLYVDDVLETSTQTTVNPTMKTVLSTMGNTFLGGMPEGPNNLNGCITNVFINRKTQAVLNLLKATDNVDVSMKCPAAKQPQQIIAAQPKHSNKGKLKKPSGSRSRNTRDSCQGELSHHERGATHFSGSTHSFQRYDILPSSFGSTPHISMLLRINSSDGLVLSATSRQRGGGAMTLRVSNGHLLLQFGKKFNLRSYRKYNDDQWHTVFIKLEGQKMSLIVDGISVQSNRISGRDRTRLTAPLYAGGVPASVAAPGSSGFVGCIRDLMLNGAPAGDPAQSQGTVPCFATPLQPGAYFSGRGGHIMIDESLALSRDLEIQLEVRPIVDSGLLLHAGTSSDHHLSLILIQGKVTVSVNGGKGETSASFIPEEPLCDGRWHAISVVKKNNVLQLHVDGASERAVGPKKGRSTGPKEAVYLGGVPGGVTVPGLPAGLVSFHGCVRRASINNRAAPLSKPLAVHGAVGTRGCPHV
ncbi:laminin subunit alpha-5 [Neolamprologus brichardi]|uniref:laminin subunit alpha-5 n=1 Tax=Neolamprologus brichardi TaxID=32507 RepID=UPI0016438FAD|nr:laminin subunit alpha-5 [Neolamprologus brichardi]